MEKLLNEDVQNQLKQVFEELKNAVTMVLFTSEEDCESCETTLNLLTEVSELSDKLNLRVYDLKSDEAKKYDIDFFDYVICANGAVTLDQQLKVIIK